MLYKITALQPIEVRFRRFNSNVLSLHPKEMPRTDEEALRMFRPPEVTEEFQHLTEDDSPIGDVVEVISLRSKDGSAAETIFGRSDFNLPLKLGDKASCEGLILMLQ